VAEPGDQRPQVSHGDLVLAAEVDPAQQRDVRSPGAIVSRRPVIRLRFPATIAAAAGG
jgi:hypothetical protein